MIFQKIYYVDNIEEESYNYYIDPKLIKLIKIKKREIHQEKFKMCIHKLKMFLPDHLIYKIGNFL